MTNKARFNACSIYYTLFNRAEEGVIKYETSVPMSGAVLIPLDPNGEPESFYTDGIEYYTASNNMGYDGDLEIALIPKSFRAGVLMKKSDSDKVLIKSSNSETANPALLFEFDDDQKRIRHITYNCSTTRPILEGETNEESREVQPETLSIQARPLPNGNIKAGTGKETTKETYDGWYESVCVPTETTVTPSRAGVRGR